uniref:non-specific serine/threonine protein kinase n=1 Tax=Panagrellus redivivus TaxID=6233 RepID=A0A7E4UTT3_PANRE
MTSIVHDDRPSTSSYGTASSRTSTNHQRHQQNTYYLRPNYYPGPPQPAYYPQQQQQMPMWNPHQQIHPRQAMFLSQFRPQLNPAEFVFIQPPQQYFLPYPSHPPPHIYTAPPPVPVAANTAPAAPTWPGPAGGRGSGRARELHPDAVTVEAGDCWNNAVVAWEQGKLIHNKVGLVVNERYMIIQNIDSGSYGTIFVAVDLRDNNKRVAVKFDTASKDVHLKYEYEVYKSALYDDGNVKVEGFPQVYWFGNEFGHNVLVMELLGPPLASLFNFCERKFGLQTIVGLGEQMIRRIRHLHQRGFIHRDIKAENFLIGLDSMETVCYLIDFGLARRYRYRDEERQLKHIPFRKGRSFVGTAKYASLNSHKNMELSRRDDIESMGYVLIELINGSLPWKKFKVRNGYSTKHQMYIRIRNLKEQTAWNDVCPSMAEWMAYCRKLPFTDEPDYDHLLALVRKIPEVHQAKKKDELSDSLGGLNFDDPRCSSCRAQAKDIRSVRPAETPKAGEVAGVENDENKPGRKLSKSASESVVNAIHPTGEETFDPTAKPASLSIHDLLLIDEPPKPFIPTASTEDDNASTASTCRQCRERRQRFFDERAAATGLKYSWQVWREASPELKFHYENRFSWTVPRPLPSQVAALARSGGHNGVSGAGFQLAVPPPKVCGGPPLTR